MKYIITESQYLILEESIIPLSIKRRANEEYLKEYISMGEINYPTLCDDFVDEYEYADAVIDYAIDIVLTGKLGSLGQPVLRSKAKELENQFANNLKNAFLS